MNLKDIYENISAQQKTVGQLPADFRPANTSPQLNGPYPGRNATRGYLVGESDNDRLSELTGDEMQYATTTAPAAADDPERQVGVLMFGRFGKTDPYARTAWAALQRELPQEYPNEQAAAARVAEIAKNGGAIVTEKPRPEAERLMKRFQAYGLKSRIVDDNLREAGNPLDDERREQRAMDREREQFKRDELEFELRGEEERMRAANAGTFYIRINGRIWRKAGEPVAFQGRERAVRAGQTIKDRDPGRDVVITRTPQDKAPIAEGQDSTYEDILTSLQRRLGDYLQDVATAVKRDPDLIDKLPKHSGEIQAVKTIHTDDGHEIKIHGNEDDGFRISIRNQDINSQFRDLDEAVMATEMYCARRRQNAMSADYIEESDEKNLRHTARSSRIMQRLRAEYPLAQNDLEALLYHFRSGQRQDRQDINRLDNELDSEESEINQLQRDLDRIKQKGAILEQFTDEEYAQAMQDFLARGGKIEKGVYKEPKMSTRLRRQGSRHIGKGSERHAGQLSGRGANVGGTGKPVVAVEETKKDACYQKVKSRYKVWPSAYASGALVQCRKKGAANWGNKSQVNEGWRETLAALAAAGIMAMSPGVSAADVAADSQQVPMIATIVIDGEVKKLDLTAKGFRDVREVEKFFDEFFARKGMSWQGKIERGVPGSGQYQRIIVQ